MAPRTSGYKKVTGEWAVNSNNSRINRILVFAYSRGSGHAIRAKNVSFTVILTPNNSGYINAVQVDGQAITPQWSGGSAPSEGGSSGRDVYTFTILKTGTGTSDYVILGALTNFA